MICPFCKNEIPLGSSFCIYCGSQLHEIEEKNAFEDDMEEDDELAYLLEDNDFDEDYSDDYGAYDDSYDDYSDEGWGDGTD